MFRHLVFAALVVMVTMLQSSSAADETLQPTDVIESDVTVQVLKDDHTATHIVTDISDFKISKVNFGAESPDRITIGSVPRTVLEGWPDLPMITQMIIVPPESGISVQINEISSRIETDFTPSIAPPQDGSVDIMESGTPSAQYLEFEGFWPPEPVKLSEPAILRGYRIVQVTFFPVQYNRSTGETRFNDLIDYHLNYEGTGSNVVVNPERPRPSSSIQRILESLTVNPPPRDEGVASADRGSYLMIYPGVNGVEEAVQPLLDWRARQGWEVHSAEVQNNASTNVVKGIIQDAYDDWDNPPEMVVLVGDAGGSVSLSAYNNTDLDYVHLDGNDILADADLGRISVESVNQLRTVVAKLVNYESDPWIEDTDWYLQGMVCAGYAHSGLSTILVNAWTRRELLERGFDEIHEWYYNAPYQGQSVPAFFQNEFQRGIAFSNYRGWVGIEGLQPNQIMGFRAHRRYPTVVLLTCSSGNYIGTFGWTEAFLRSAGGGNGAVGLCTNNTRVQFNNAISTGIWVGFLKEDLLNFGTAVNRGRFELYRQYHGFSDNDVNNFSRWTNLMGDPATHIFTGVPRTILVNHDAELASGANRLTVTVFDEENEVALPEALVCLYKADDDFQMVAFTDETGITHFNLPADELSEGDLLITVTKHNTVPYLGEIAIAEREYFLGAGSWEVDDDNENASSGDDDQIPNPGETIELMVALTNYGNDSPEGEITVTAESLSQWAEITSDPVQLNQAPNEGESTDVGFVLEIDPSAPDGTIVLVSIDATDGEATWSSLAALNINAPRLQIDDIEFEDRHFNPGEVVRLDVELFNTGTKATGPFRAVLHSLNTSVTFLDAETEYQNIDPQHSAQLDGNMFRIRAHPFTIPGSSADIYMTIETENGFADTTDLFTFNVGDAEEGDPFGPDEYGYVCFDSGDEGWEMTPVYDWIEIDPEYNDRDFNGENTGLRDQSEDSDRSQVVDLPFEFQYYGEVFEELTICTNGWAAFGNWRELSDFRNRRIASGGGPNAQLCVFWDNLTTGDIFTHYDDEGGRFIVEWKNMQRQWGGGGNQTFELILYDQQLHPTYSGDGVIVFQYQQIENASGSDQNHNDTPYCTVGIGNLNDMDGLEYTYWNQYHPAAERLDDGLAIKFTTAVEFITGVLRGYVRDVENGNPIPGAQVITSRGFYAETDENGEYFIDEILIGEGYVVSASAQGYNDSTWAGEEGAGFTIIENDTVDIDFNLLHPEFNYDAERFHFQMNADDTLSSGFNLSNDGNGTLWYSSKFTYVLEQDDDRDDPDDMWDPLLVWTAEDSVGEEGDNKIQGVTFVEDHWMVSGGGNGQYEENWFYRFDRWGNFIDRIPQPVEDNRYGLRDMEYYNGSLYCAYPDSGLILRLDPETGERLSQYTTPRGLSTPVDITLDPEGNFWVSSITSNIYKLELVGDSALSTLETFTPVDPRDNTRRIRVYGISWFRDDPDQYHLYMMSNNAPFEDPEGVLPNISLFKLNPADGEIEFLTHLPSFTSGNNGRGGISITPKWNNMVWAIAAVIDNPDGDMIGVMELGPNSSWIDYSPRNNTLFAEEVQYIDIVISTADLDTGEYGVNIEFTHNARGGIDVIPVDLVITTSGIQDESTIPLEYSLTQNWPNPFNSTSRISYSLRQPGLTRLTLFDTMGREVSRLVDRQQAAGHYQLVIDGGGLPAGLYFYRLQSGSFQQVRKMLLIK